MLGALVILSLLYLQGGLERLERNVGPEKPEVVFLLVPFQIFIRHDPSPPRPLCFPRPLLEKLAFWIHETPILHTPALQGSPDPFLGSWLSGSTRNRLA